MADLLLAADDVIERDEDVPPPVGSILEALMGREVAAADLDALEVGWHERERDPQLATAAEVVVGVVELEGQPEDRCDRSKGDVALLPIEADAEDRRALVVTLANDAVVSHRGGVRARLRARQTEAGDLPAVRQPG